MYRSMESDGYDKNASGERSSTVQKVFLRAQSHSDSIVVWGDW